MMKPSTLVERGPSPPTSTLRPPDISHVIGVPRPSPFFAALPLPCIILNVNRRTKNGGGPGTRLSVTSVLLLCCYNFHCLLCTVFCLKWPAVLGTRLKIHSYMHILCAYCLKKIKAEHSPVK